MKMTAVEWLIEEIHKNVCWIPIHIQNQAKEMEKQQIMDAYDEGRNYGFKSNGEEYYNENFKIK